MDDKTRVTHNQVTKNGGPGPDQVPAVTEHHCGGAMAKRHCRPSSQYRYEHYDPFTG